MVDKKYLRRKGINCINNIIKTGIEDLNHPFILDVFLIEVSLRSGFISSSLIPLLRLWYAFGAFKCQQLPVTVRWMDLIAIDNCHGTDTCTADHLRGIGTHTSQSDNKNLCCFKLLYASAPRSISVRDNQFSIKYSYVL